MPAVQITPGDIASEVQRRAARQLGPLLARVRAAARRAADYRRELTELGVRLDNLRMLNDEFTNVTSRDAVLFLTVIAGVVAVFLMDIVFAAPTAQYFAHVFLPGLPRLAAIAPYVLPAVVISVELLVGARRAQAAELFEMRALVGWTLFACLMTILMPALSAATQLAQPEHLRTPAFWVRTIAICGFGVVLHGVICFTGDFIHRAKSYALFAIRHRVLDAQTRTMDSRVRAANRRAVDAFADFLQARTDAGVVNSPVPPFDVDTRRELELGFGHPVVPGPAAPAEPVAQPAADPYDRAAADALANSAPAGDAADAGANGEVDYLRRVLDARVREADSQVTG